MLMRTLSVSKNVLRLTFALLKCALRLSADTGLPAMQRFMLCPVWN
jgi:hypothetical protein